MFPVLHSTGELPEGLTKLRRLKVVDLSSNKLEGEGIARISRFGTARGVSGIPLCSALVEGQVLHSMSIGDLALNPPRSTI